MHQSADQIAAHNEKMAAAVASSRYDSKRLGGGRFLIEGKEMDLSASDPKQVERIVEEAIA